VEEHPLSFVSTEYEDFRGNNSDESTGGEWEDFCEEGYELLGASKREQLYQLFECQLSKKYLGL
jgi:hypothetical protein